MKSASSLFSLSNSAASREPIAKANGSADPRPAGLVAHWPMAAQPNREWRLRSRAAEPFSAIARKSTVRGMGEKPS